MCYLVIVLCRAPTSEGFNHPIDPAQRMHLQFGLFSIQTSGPQLVHQRLWYVLSCMWESANKRFLAAYRKDSRVFSKKKYVTITICLTSYSWYETQCALEVSLNKTNFPFLLGGFQDGSRRRTPGGVFLFLLRNDRHIRKDEVNLIFKDEREVYAK